MVSFGRTILQWNFVHELKPRRKPKQRHPMTESIFTKLLITITSSNVDWMQSGSFAFITFRLAQNEIDILYHIAHGIECYIGQ